jgi:hypothetical protein
VIDAEWDPGGSWGRIRKKGIYMLLLLGIWAGGGVAASRFMGR